MFDFKLYVNFAKSPNTFEFFSLFLTVLKQAANDADAPSWKYDGQCQWCLHKQVTQEQEALFLSDFFFHSLDYN